VATGLQLDPVTPANVRAACKLKLRPDQEDLVAPVAWSLADAYTMPDIAWPRLIYDDGQLVGFVMAAFAPAHENPLFHSYLWRLVIGAEHQGHGYGRFAVEEVRKEAVRRGHHRLTVCYHADEQGPEDFYRRLGFRPTGEYNEGETVAELILSTEVCPDAAGHTDGARQSSPWLGRDKRPRRAWRNTVP
jgi:diamine N-acetyltransferase